jgi:carbonic anhydrase/acetyltransferase-like protein (isoleucine patch superfamily)
MALLLPHHNVMPQIEGALYVAPNATLIGDIVAGPECSFWFGAVLRGDVGSIRIGRATNIQDLSMLHMSYRKADLKIGDEVTIGHGVILHACTIGNRVLVGMGSQILDNAVIEDDVLIGAGSIVTERVRIPAGHLALGRPAKVIRPLTPEEIRSLKQSADHYKNVARSYCGGPWPYKQ